MAGAVLRRIGLGAFRADPGGAGSASSGGRPACGRSRRPMQGSAPAPSTSAAPSTSGAVDGPSASANPNDPRNRFDRDTASAGPEEGRLPALGWISGRPRGAAAAAVPFLLSEPPGGAGTAGRGSPLLVGRPRRWSQLRADTLDHGCPGRRPKRRARSIGSWRQDVPAAAVPRPDRPRPRSWPATPVPAPGPGDPKETLHQTTRPSARPCRLRGRTTRLRARSCPSAPWTPSASHRKTFDAIEGFRGR